MGLRNMCYDLFGRAGARTVLRVRICLRVVLRLGMLKLRRVRRGRLRFGYRGGMHLGILRKVTAGLLLVLRNIYLLLTLPLMVIG